MATHVHRARFFDFAPSGVTAMALHPSGGWLALARECGDVELWRAGTTGAAWVEVATLPGSARLAIQSAVWVSAAAGGDSVVDGARLLLASLSGAVLEACWHTASTHTLVEPGGGALWAVAAWAALSPRRGSARALLGAPGVLTNLLALGSEDGALRIFDVGLAPRSVPRLLGAGHATDGRILSLAWHPLLPLVFTGTANGRVRGWDMTAVLAELASSPTTATAARARSATHDDSDDSSGDESDGVGRADGGKRGVAIAGGGDADALAASLGLTLDSGAADGHGSASVDGTTIAVAAAARRERLMAQLAALGDAEAASAGIDGRKHLRGPLPLLSFSTATSSKQLSSVWAIAVTR